VKGALDFKETARANREVDRAIETSSRDIEGLCARRFYPTVATRYKDWPNYQYARPWRLWLDCDELISVSSLSSGGTTISASDYFLEPVNLGPPYTYIEIDLDSSASFGGGTSPQRTVAITGVFGYGADTTPAGTLAAAISSASATTCDVTDSASVGVGSIIAVDSERMIVTGKTQLTTAQTVQTSALTALASNDSVIVTTGSAFAIGESITVDSEVMLIVNISGNTLTVKRAWDGSALASHNIGVTIYAPRTLTVTRGALGTTAATHLISAAITAHVVPAGVRDLTVAKSEAIVLQHSSGWTRDKADALAELERSVVRTYARQARMRAV
jgi:hypothetical protein